MMRSIFFSLTATALSSAILATPSSMNDSDAHFGQVAANNTLSSPASWLLSKGGPEWSLGKGLVTIQQTRLAKRSPVPVPSPNPSPNPEPKPSPGGQMSLQRALAPEEPVHLTVEEAVGESDASDHEDGDLVDATDEHTHVLPTEQQEIQRAHGTRLRYMPDTLTLRQKIDLWARLRADLEKISNIQESLEDWKIDVVHNQVRFFDPPSEQGAISWRLVNSKRNVARLSRAVKVGVVNRRFGGSKFVLQLLHRDIDPSWPVLDEPVYRAFQLQYDAHVAEVERLLQEKERRMVLLSRRGEDKEHLEELTADLTAQAKAEAMMAFDVLRVLQLTYRNIIVEIMQTATRYNNIRKGRSEHYLDFLTYGDTSFIDTPSESFYFD